MLFLLEIYCSLVDAESVSLFSFPHTIELDLLSLGAVGSTVEVAKFWFEFLCPFREVVNLVMWFGCLSLEDHD